jgi:hypothetical protein
VNLYGASVPVASGNEGLTFDNPITNGQFAFESWASAVAIVAANHSWRPGALRIVVPISDEGPENGLSGVQMEIPDPNNPGGTIIIIRADKGDCDQADTDATTNAIDVAIANDVVLSPIAAFLLDFEKPIATVPFFEGEFHECVIEEGGRMANSTGGTLFQVDNPAAQISNTLFDLVIEACRQAIQLDPP